MKKIVGTLFVVGVLFLSSACSDRQKNKAREDYYDAVESVDNAVDKAGNRIDRGVDRVEDAWDDVRDDFRESGQDLRRDINEVSDTIDKRYRLD